MTLFFIIATALFAITSIVLGVFYARARIGAEKYIEQTRTVQDMLEQTVTTRDHISERLMDSQQALAAADQSITNLKQQREEWERLKDQHLEASKASILKAGSDLSNKLLEDHKRESEAFKKQNQQKIAQETEKLHKQYEQVFGSMETLHAQVKDMGEIRQALLEPSGAGALAELTLENLFKASSLQRGRDYELQYHLKSKQGKDLRPDAIVFLPDDNLLVIDSKASKFFMENARANSDEDKAQATQEMKKTMRAHLKDLTVRDYEHIVHHDQTITSNHVMMLMFLPTDAALESLLEADPTFWHDAHKAGITPVGPAGLTQCLMRAHLQVGQLEQQKNILEIRDAVLKMLKSVATLHGHSEKMGKQLKSTLTHYNNFAKSFNSSFTRNIREIEQLGIESPQSNKVNKLEQYQLITDNIEGNAEEVIKPHLIAEES